jgi:hypothetical protein
VEKWKRLRWAGHIARKVNMAWISTRGWKPFWTSSHDISVIITRVNCIYEHAACAATSLGGGGGGIHLPDVYPKTETENPNTITYIYNYLGLRGSQAN